MALPVVGLAGVGLCAYIYVRRFFAGSSWVPSLFLLPWWMMQLPDRVKALSEKHTQEFRVRSGSSLLFAVRRWAAENGYTLNRACVLLMYEGLSSRLQGGV